MVEAMDDSIIFATSLPLLRHLVLSAERFQAAYGWLTSWQKSLLLLRNVPDPPPTLQMPSVDPEEMLSDTVPMQDVVVVSNHMEFLRVAINDPHQQFLRLRDIVDSFEFPNLYHRLPFTLLRRLIIQCLVSKIRPHLAYQPLLRADARSLDMAIARKIHNYLRFPFPFNSTLLSMPFDLHGFQFPSISHLNDCAAVVRLLHDLNHHLPLFRDMAAISLADWTCSIAHCHSPINANSPSFQRSYARLPHKLPTSWIIAHHVMRELNLSVHNTDLSFLTSGSVSLQHLSHFPSPSAPSAPLLRSLALAGISQLRQLASWAPAPDPLTWSLRPHPDLAQLLRYTSVLPHLPSIISWISSLSLPLLTYGHLSLAIPPPICQRQAERDLLSISHLFRPPLLPSSSSLVVSDASMRPSPVLPLQFRSITFASASPTATFQGSLANFGRSASILYGELYGILVASLFAFSSSSTPPPIYSDHLNAVNFLNNHLSSDTLSHSWSSVPARSLYYWILSVLQSTPHRPQLRHVCAHTASSDPISLANSFIDHLASSSQNLLIPPPPVPLPTFTMDKFTAYLPPFQYIESNLPNLLNSLLASHSFFDPSFVPLHTLSPLLYDPSTPPLHPYTCASSAYSVVIQLYACSHQLPTNISLAAHFNDRLMLCRFGCQTIEDDHHLFVHCPHFNTVWQEFTRNLISESSRILSDKPLPTPVTSHLEHLAGHLFRDDDCWPLASSHFYLGLLPHLLPKPFSSQTLSPESMRIVTRLGHCYHTSAIHLAG